MPTITPPKKQRVVTRREFTLSEYQRRELAKLLGIKPRDRQEIFALLLSHFSDQDAALRGAPLAPTRAHHIGAFVKVQKDAERLYRTITELPDHHRALLPDVGTFVDQLAKFHDGIQTGLYQMRGRGSARGGAKKQVVAGARKTVEHSLGIFFDLNARAPNGKLRSEGLTAPVFVQERLLFIEFCMDLLNSPTA